MGTMELKTPEEKMSWRTSSEGRMKLSTIYATN
jgi:hypothetical protein